MSTVTENKPKSKSIIQVLEFCKINTRDCSYLQKAIDQLGLSARAYHRVLKLARTIADLDQHEMIVRADLQEALGYRKVANCLEHSAL